METELNRLIDKIKKEGVEQAEKDAGDIIDQAEAKAKGIIADAERRRAEIIEKAEAQAQDFRTTSERALKQAARDVLLTLRERVTEFFDRIVKEKVSGELTLDVLGEVIVKAVGNFRKDSDLNIEVLVNEKDRDKLEKILFSALNKEAKRRFTLKGVSNIEKGFRIGEEGKDSYIDFSDEAITEAFKRYLNPKLVEILDIGLGMDKE
ncbi:hypothetical protein OAA99_01620 [Omnitrophica bacterium]|nr:hypothetical protein [Candidatus Omnitrophota bacterium]